MQCSVVIPLTETTIAINLAVTDGVSVQELAGEGLQGPGGQGEASRRPKQGENRGRKRSTDSIFL